MAIFFYGDKKIKTTHFGSAGMSDYTKHNDDERKKLYLARHKKNEDWNNYMTAGALSRWILWEEKNIPDVLLSGDHTKIKDWRLSQSEAITRHRRPDLWQKYKKD